MAFISPFMTYYVLVLTLRIHIEEINHTVLLHMTEKMGYKHSEVLSAVLTNKACHTLAVYFLLNNKMKRLSKEYRVVLRNQHLHNYPSAVPKLVPVYPPVSKGPTKEKEQRTGKCLDYIQC